MLIAPSTNYVGRIGNPSHNKPTVGRIGNPSHRTRERRQGVVLLAVLIVVVLLSLAAYNYSDLMLAEYKASDNYHKNAQARAFADSGIHYAMAMLSNPDNIAGQLNDNPFDNALHFKDRSVQQAGDKTGQGYFTLIAPLDASDSGSTGPCRFGAIDEASKININAMMKIDKTGDKLYKMLLLLPNMTDEIANSIIDWLDADSTPRQGGAESDYYSGLSPSYQCKNGPLDSIEELLLVKGVTPQLLFGSDLNRNGYQEPDENSNGTGATSGFDRGWSAYLTIYSREQNVDAQGAAFTNLNDSAIDLPTMYDTLSTKLGEDLAKFIIIYRQYGGTEPAATTPTPSLGGTIAALLGVKGKGGSSTTKTGNLASYNPPDFLTKKASKKITSLYDLVSREVQIKTTDPKTKKDVTTIYKSPLSDPAQRADLLPKLFQTATVWADTAEISARINLNTAPHEVVATLPELDAADVQAIMGARPQYSSSDSPGAVYQTPTWLITQANIDPKKLSKLDKLITTRTQVYRVQSLGYFDAARGPVARVEAVIDTNGGFPRILAWRDMADFGRVRPPQ